MVGNIVGHADFIKYHAAFLVYIRLKESRIKHHIGDYVEPAFQMTRADSSEYIEIFLSGGGVKDTSRTFESKGNVAWRLGFCPFEHKMFYEVGDAGDLR